MLHVQLGPLFSLCETDFPPVTVIILAVTLAFGKFSPVSVRGVMVVNNY